MMGVVNLAFTLFAVLTVEKFGRKPLLFWGSIGMAIGAAGVALSNLSGDAGMLPVVSDSSLVKVRQRIDRPPSLLFGCEQLVFYCSLFGRFLTEIVMI